MASTLIRKALNTLLKLYFLPVKASGKLRRFVKDVILLNEEEHITKPIRFLQTQKLLNAEPVILDIGTAYGTAVDTFLHLLPQSKVFAFEPNPRLVADLNNKFAGKRVVVHNLALSNKEGVVSFNESDNELSSSYKSFSSNDQFALKKTFEVKTNTLDNIFKNGSSVSSIDIMKLDVQGAEMDVLEGGSQTLKKTKILIVEQSIRSPYEGGAKYYEVDEFLRGLGFEILDIVITYRKKGMVLTEFDSIYINKSCKINFS